VLADERGGAGILSSGREALDELREDEEPRGEHADHGVAREQADREGRGGHQYQRHRQHLLAANFVAEPAEEDTTERAGDERGGEGAEQEQRLHRLVGLRQKTGPIVVIR
jgi:hypothetical protein